jgi:hypothetical protein
MPRALEVGCLLGEAVLEPGSGEVLQVAESVQSPAFVRSLEVAIQMSAGKFVAIVVTPFARVYTGPGAMLGVVFNATERCVASSLLLAATISDPDKDLREALDIPHQDRVYPFGLTPDRRVRRLLPHHYLDLESFQSTRWWPTRKAAFATETEPSRVVDKIVERLRQQVVRIAGDQPVAISLTAGRDSRMVLASARHLFPKITCYTFGLPDANARLDCRAAAALARRAHIEHRVLPWIAPGETDLQDWQVRTGHCVAGRVWQLVSTQSQLGDGIRLSGIGGEVGRCFYWRRQDLNGAKLSGEELIRRLRLPLHPHLISLSESWLASLPANEAPDVLDLLYIERRLGCWAGPQGYGHRTSARCPFVDQRVFELMLSLPWAYRFEQKLAVDLISRLWPELLAYPFNQEFGLRRVLKSVGKRARARVRAFRIRSFR